MTSIFRTDDQKMFADSLARFFADNYDIPKRRKLMLEEPGYDPDEDLARFNEQAHVLIITVRVHDFALEDMLKHLRKIRDSQPGRPVVLALTCLHEAYPQEQHREPYPFDASGKVVDDGGAALGQPVDERRLADVREADDRDGPGASDLRLVHGG